MASRSSGPIQDDVGVMEDARIAGPDLDRLHPSRSGDRDGHDEIPKHLGPAGRHIIRPSRSKNQVGRSHLPLRSEFGRGGGIRRRTRRRSLLHPVLNQLHLRLAEPALFRYITALVRRTREWPSLSLGASPRAAISLMMVAKAIAAMDGRGYLIPDDVKSVVAPVLRHRIMLKPEADLEGATADQIIRDVVAAVEVPK